MWWGLVWALIGGAALNKEMLLLAVVGGKALRGILIFTDALNQGLLEWLKLFMSVCHTEGMMKPTGNAKHSGGALLKS